MERKNTHSSSRDGFLLRSVAATSSELVLQWGNRKRLRCMKVQAKNPSGSRSTAGIDLRLRSNLNNNTTTRKDLDQTPNQKNNNVHQRPSSPSPRILRNTDSSIGMMGHSNGVRGLVSPDRKDEHHHGSLDTPIHGGGDSVWPPNLVIALTNKEKEEDYFAIKGCKLPQRPKKRAKIIQRTLNVVSPGAWLCDLSLERYEVREKKVSCKKRPRGLKGMSNIDSDSE